MRLKLAVCFLVAIASLAPASDQPAAVQLPESVAMVVSLSSPMHFLESLDSYLSTALAETPAGYQPGLLPVLSMMFLPSPVAESNLDAETHLIFLAGGRSVFERGVLLASIGDYQQYLNAAARGEDVTEEENAIAVITTSDDITFYLADAGGGKAIVGDSRQNVLDALKVVESWQPNGDTGGALEVTLSSLAKIDPRGELESLIEETVDKCDEFGLEAAESLDKYEFNGEVAKGFARVLKRGAELFGRELAGLAGGKMELVADGDNLLIRFFLTPGEDGFIRKVVGHASALSNTVYPTTGTGDSSVLSVSQIAPMQSIIPDHLNFFRNISDAVLKDSMPALQDEAGRGTEQFFSGGPGEIVRFIVTHETTVDLVKADDPKTVFEAFTNSFRTLDKALEIVSGKHAATRARIVVKDETIGGVDVRSIQMVFDQDSAWERILEDSDDEELQAIIEKIEKLHYVMTFSDKHVALVTTERSPEDAVKVLAGLTGATAPLVETPRAKAALDAMRYRQIGFGLVSPHNFVRLVIENIIATQNVPEAGIRVLEGVLNDLIVSDELFGFGNGVGTDGYACEALFTAEGVNNLVRNYYLVTSREEALYGPGPDSEGDMNGEYNFDEYEENGSADDPE